MKVLYYLEPYVEFGNPLFRMATIRNHLEPEIAGLQLARARDVEVRLLCSEAVADVIRVEARLPGVPLVTVAQAELEPIYPEYLEASARFYEGNYTGAALERAMALYRRKLGAYEPDVIVCYESNAPFLAKLFPRALFLHNTLGIFSRAPFPETSALDPFGIGKDSYLSRCGTQLTALELSGAQRARLERLKESAQRAQVERSPLARAALRQGYERVVLLPLQVSKYFMFDENLPEELRGVDQLGLLERVLEGVDRKIGVCVTMHRSEARLLTPTRCKELRARFPHFLYDPDVQRVPWPSQHVLPHVDGVVTVSSAVGLLAMLWDLPIVGLGRSHVAAIASSRSLADLPSLLSNPPHGARDGALYHLLTTYYPQMDRFHHQGDWYRGFLADCHARKDEPCRLGFFREIADPDQVFEGLIQGLRADEANSAASATSMKGTMGTSQGGALRSKLQQADVVSFDVFDTLVTRPLSEPNALFDLIAEPASQALLRHGVRIEDFGEFSELRRQAAKHASAEALESGSEEYNLLLVYGWLVRKLGAPQALVEELKAIEEQAELTIALPREAGREAYQQALNLRKRVLLISDTYLDSRLVADIVKRCGYTGFERLFVSSDFGKLKRTGNLYGQVRLLVGAGQRWLHVGDNSLSDVRVPERLGIGAYHLSSATTHYANDPLVRAALPSKPGTSLGARIASGVIARKFFDRPTASPREARFDGSPYRLGFEAGGPLFLGFASWILEEARRDGITDLYFLARDGLVPKQVSELLLEGGGEGPATHYIWASRRAYLTAALETPSDVLSTLGLLFRTATVRSFFGERFGLEEAALVPGSLSAAGFGSIDDPIVQDDATDMARLRTLVLANVDGVLARASQERELLMGYLRERGLFDPHRKIALVDLGHNASLQVALARLSGRKDLVGYYFATFKGARGPYLQGHALKSYLIEFEDAARSDHPYARNLGVFEFLFLPPEPSFMRFEQTSQGERRPVFAEVDERPRFDVVREVQRGALDFARDAVQASLGQRQALGMSKNEATRSFAKYCVEPDLADAELLNGIGFASGLGSRDVHYLIAPVSFHQHRVNESWWRIGAEVVVGLRSSKPSALGDAGAWKRKLLKLQRDPGRFLSDMRLVRKLREFVD
ncbi:MAG: HAD-IA family hydrolase [Myxococcales bacterium]